MTHRCSMRWKYVFFYSMSFLVSFFKIITTAKFFSLALKILMRNRGSRSGWALHAFQGLDTKNFEALLQDIGCGFAENETLIVDSNFTGLFVLLHAVASIVELGECRGQLIHVVAQTMKQ